MPALFDHAMPSGEAFEPESGSAIDWRGGRTEAGPSSETYVGVGTGAVCVDDVSLRRAESLAAKDTFAAKKALANASVTAMANFRCMVLR